METVNSASNVVIRGTSDADSISNLGDSASVNAGDGDAYICNNSSPVSIATGMGNDTIRNDYAGETVTIDTGGGNDVINNLGGYVTIQSRDGDDIISNSIGSSVTIDAGAGKGDDVISLSSGTRGSALIEYSSSDGDDTVYGFNVDLDGLKLSAAADTSTVTVGNNVIVNVSEGSTVGSITLMDLAEGDADSDTDADADADADADTDADEDKNTTSGGSDTTASSTLDNPNARLTLSDETAGVFVVDGTQMDDPNEFYDAEFKTETVASDIVVGSVTADHEYVASSDTGKQSITVTSDWLVTASALDDSIIVSESNATVNGGDGADSIIVGASVESITIDNMQSTDKIIFEQAIGARTLSSLESDGDLILSSDALSITFKDKTIVTLNRYVVSDASTDVSIAQLINNPIGIRLSSASNNVGTYSLDPTSTSKSASFSTTLDADNYVVGRVDSSRVYTAESYSPAQSITAASNWNVTASTLDDLINVTGSNTTINGGEGSDSITIGSSVSMVSFVDLQADERLTFERTIAEGSLYTLESEGIVTLYSDQIGIAFNNRSLSAISTYTIDNNGTINTIDQLLYHQPTIIPDPRIDLANAGASGVFVVNAIHSVSADELFSDATFKAEADEDDIIVGSVTADHEYVATSDTGRQLINAVDGWNVTDSTHDDLISVTGSNTTILGGEGADSITIGSSVSTVSFVDLQADDRLTFEQTIAERSLYSIEEADGVTLRSDQITLNFAASPLSSIKDYTVINGGSETRFEDLIAADDVDDGTDTHRVQLNAWTYGYTPTNSVVSLNVLASLDEDQLPTDFALSRTTRTAFCALNVR